MDIYNQVKMLTLGKMPSANVDIQMPTANVIDDNTDDSGFILGAIALIIVSFISWIIYQKYKNDKEKEKINNEIAQKLSENTFYKSS